MLTIYNKRVPFFSIIICTFNRAGILKRAIDSLMNQSERDWEAIIVDDGSSDDTYTIVKSYCDSFDNFKYIYHKNKGLAYSKNVGILAASGLYVSFLDSDDEYDIEHLSTRKSILMDYPELDLLHGGLNIIGDEFVPDRENPNEMVHLNECTVGGTFFIKKNSIMETDGFRDVGYAEDSEFYNRLKCLGYTIAKTTQPTYIYHREMQDSITNLKTEEIRISK